MLRGVSCVLLLLGGGLALFFGLVGGGAGWAAAGPASPPDAAPRPAACMQCRPLHPSDRVVLLMVDALRHSTVFRPGNQFRYVNEMVDTGVCRAAMAIARPPTVTLPRLKSLMAGKVSVFTDLLFNFFGRTVEEDSVLLQARRGFNRTLVVHGDDTWVRTWPALFDARSDPVRSFFVSDYTEVDNNVTRHIAPELTVNADWDLLVLHYLGIDHIGHYLGPLSPVMDAKEREMDGIIERIHRQLPDGTLLLVVSDHGMTRSGNHGGSAAEEVETVLLAMGPTAFPSHGRDASANARNPSTVQQIDVAATLALLWNVSIPSGNAGVFWPALFDAGTFPQCAECNAAQLRARAGAAAPAASMSDAERFAELDALSEGLAETPEPQLATTAVGAVLVFAAYCVATERGAAVWRAGASPVPVVVSAALALSCFASTFAEEFHCLAHYAAATWLLLQLPGQAAAGRSRGLTATLGVLALLRLMFSWTQSGILALDNPGEHPRIADYFKAHDAMHIPHTALWGCGAMWLLYTHADRSWAWTAVQVFAWSVQLVCYTDVGRGTEVALRWGGMAGAAAWVWRCGAGGMNLAAWACCVAPPDDAVVVMVAAALPRLLHRARTEAASLEHDVAVWLVCLCAQTAPGRSISLGHLEFSPAYSAVLEYHPVPLAFLVLLLHFAALIVALVPHLRHAGVRRLALRFAVLNVLAAAGACYWFHAHLFIWTVFTPKLLFAVLDALAVFLLCAPFV
eukprot:TRINITY_DN3246_c0_g3_i1.p1 TRINITY_DN3246_c0_g3~~TRINITY_DN3246_c0_g3_i1.p1  ORF type:complete len:739 (+),score=240.63 TRINITY_DN3246_c0_g3_i1:876-3092(+)